MSKYWLTVDPDTACVWASGRLGVGRGREGREGVLDWRGLG